MSCLLGPSTSQCSNYDEDQCHSPCGRQQGTQLPKAEVQYVLLSLLYSCSLPLTIWLIEDGKEMQLDTEKLKINDVVEEVDRHSRMLNRKAELEGN